MKKNAYVERAVRTMNIYADQDNRYVTETVKATSQEPIGEMRDRIYDTVEAYSKERVEGNKKLYEKVIRNSYSEGYCDGEERGVWLGAGAVGGGIGIGIILGKIITHFMKKRTK